MDYIATQNYVLTTPRKLRLIADAARKLSPQAAVAVLPYSKKRAAEPLMKTVKTAIANAKVMGADETKLIFKEIQISQGPALSRGIAVSRGQWHPYKKRMSHIRVVLTEKTEKVKKIEEKKSEVKTEKSVKKVAAKTKKK